MRFKIDENVPASIKEIFVEAGHEASDVYEERLAGASDEVLAAVCKDEKRILSTLDLDFASIVTYPPSTHPGIAVFRLPRLDANAVGQAARELLSSVNIDQLQGAITIVSRRDCASGGSADGDDLHCLGGRALGPEG